MVDKKLIITFVLLLLVSIVFAQNESFSIKEKKSILKDKNYYLIENNLSVDKKDKITLTNLKKIDKEQRVFIELSDKKFKTKKVKKKELFSLLDNESIKKIWPDRELFVNVNDASSITGANNFNSIEGNNVKVCVLDTGVKLNHSMLIDKEIFYEDFTSEGFYDGHGHGTHVATTLAGSDFNYTGIAPLASLYVGKVLDSSGSGYLSWLINGIDWCINNNVSIISMSLGATYSEEPEELLDAPEILKVKDAVNNGILVVIASGNYGQGMVTTPGLSLDALTVGAVDKNNLSTSFSGFGFVNGTLKPDIVAPGVDICAGSLNGYSCLSGTSMATPIVAGLGALLFDSVNDVKEYLINNSKDIGLDFGLAYVNEIEPQSIIINSFKVYADYIDDGARFVLDVDGTSNVTLIVDGDEFNFNGSFDFVYNLDGIGNYDYSLKVNNETLEGSFFVNNYKINIPTFNLGVSDSVDLLFKNLNVSRNVDVVVKIKDIDGFLVLNESSYISYNESESYSIDFRGSLPGKYKIYFDIDGKEIEKTLKVSMPLMSSMISPMRVVMR